MCNSLLSRCRGEVKGHMISTPDSSKRGSSVSWDRYGCVIQWDRDVDSVRDGSLLDTIHDVPPWPLGHKH